MKQWTKSFLSYNYAVITVSTIFAGVDVQSPNRNANTGRVLTVRRSCSVNGVEVPKHVGRTLRIDYVFFLVHGKLVTWVELLML